MELLEISPDCLTCKIYHPYISFDQYQDMSKVFEEVVDVIGTALALEDLSINIIPNLKG